MAAYVEVFGRTGTIPQAEINLRLLAEMSLSRDLVLADLTNRKALGFGIDAANMSSPDYGHAQQLSAVLYDAGFHGVYYRVRHDPQVDLEAVALFGPPGEHPDEFDPPKTTQVPTDLVDEASDEFGLVVLPATPLP